MTATTQTTMPPLELGPMPTGRRMTTVNEARVRAPLDQIFPLVAEVERWPALLRHYRHVRFIRRDGRGGGIVEMSANRPFGLFDWPTFWRSEMQVIPPGQTTAGPGGTTEPVVRFRHIGGITTGMDVAWEFRTEGNATHVRIVHVWNGPRWPLIGVPIARAVIGPLFVHHIAGLTLAGLGQTAEHSE